MRFHRLYDDIVVIHRTHTRENFDKRHISQLESIVGGGLNKFNAQRMLYIRFPAAKFWWDGFR